MEVMITAEGSNDPVGHHYMSVDNRGFLIDLHAVKGTLVDPTIARVTWGPVVYNGVSREAGTITQRDGVERRFFNKALIEPYLTEWQIKRLHHDAEMQAQAAAKT